MRLIDANALYWRLREIADCEWNKKAAPVSWADAYESFIDTVYDEPVIDAVHMGTARWIELDAYAGMEQYKCSACLTECYVPTCMGEPMYGFCPNCGAKIDGGNDHATD